MRIEISYFYNIRFFKPNEIPVNTAIWPPTWYNRHGGSGNYFIDGNGVFNGISEESLVMDLDVFMALDEQCEKNCRYKGKAPNCDFMKAYSAQLSKIDFDGYLLPEFKRIAEDVRKITHYEGEPTIVLMVFEKPDAPCAERPCLKKLFNDHGIDLKEWRRQAV